MAAHKPDGSRPKGDRPDGRVIFVVEDDDNIRELVVYALTSSGFDARGFADGSELPAETEAAPAPDLWLLDIMLPGEDGIALLKRLKSSEKTAATPVIMLTAKGSENDRIKGLDLGADDYITKPFSVLEVIARIRAVLRRSTPDRGEPTVFRAGGITLYADKRSVFLGSREIALTFKEFELLYYLMRNPGIVLSRSRILEQVWGYAYAETRTVDMHIKAIRQKFAEAGAGGGESGGENGVENAIKTVRNVGYKIEDAP